MPAPDEGLTTTVCTVPPDASVDEAASVMTSQGVGDVIVVRDGIPIGIVTDRDLVVRVLAAGRLAGDIQVREVMSQPLVTVTRNEDVSAALALMKSHGIRRLPIVDEEGRLTSILTMDDIQLLGLSDQPELVHVLRQQLRHQKGRNAAPAAAANRIVEPSTVSLSAAPPAPANVSLAGPVAGLVPPSVVVPMTRVHHHHQHTSKLRHHVLGDWINRHLFWFVFLLLLTLGAATVYLLTSFLGSRVIR